MLYLCWGLFRFRNTFAPQSSKIRQKFWEFRGEIRNPGHLDEKHWRYLCAQPFLRQMCWVKFLKFGYRLSFLGYKTATSCFEWMFAFNEWTDVLKYCFEYQVCSFIFCWDSHFVMGPILRSPKVGKFGAIMIAEINQLGLAFNAWQIEVLMNACPFARTRSTCSDATAGKSRC